MLLIGLEIARKGVATTLYPAPKELIGLWEIWKANDAAGQEQPFRTWSTTAYKNDVILVSLNNGACLHIKL